MPVAYTAPQQAELDGKARALLIQCPDVGGLIRRGLRLNPDAETLVYLRTPLDPAPVVTKAHEFEGLLNAATLWLRRQGVGPSDVVSLLAPNCTATSVVYWAAMSGATVQPLNLLFTREAILAQIDAVKAKLLFTPPPGAPGGLYEKVEGLQKLAPSLQRIVVLPIDGRVACDDEILAPTDARDDSDVAAPERIVALLPTGGTTSAPKIVPLSNANVVAGALGSLLAMDARPDDRALITLPLFHVGGAFCFSLAVLGAGGALVLPTAGGMRNPEAVVHFWRMIESQRITISGGVPTVLAALGAIPSAGADISRLRQIVTGGSVCPPEIERRFLKQWPGDIVRKLCGMTEFAGAITQTPWNFGERPGSVGVPVALVEVAVLAGGVLHRGPSPSGEILARGPQMFAGYFEAQAAGATFHDGWLRSGDLGHIGADGEVYVTGRAKDVIIRGGHNIDPAGIEDVALAFPGVALAAAVGRPDAYAGETPILFVSPEPGAFLNEAALADFMQARVAEPPARPRAIVVIAEMPVTPVGKIFKPRLRELAAERAAWELLEAALPGVVFDVEARHDKRGLLLKVTAPASAVEAARTELGKLPVAFEVIVDRPRPAP
jgi:fatty-acyl-CoA synthase